MNWRRERVRQWELAALERALGKAAADEIRFAPQIVGGTKAAAGAWPFQIALLDSGISSNYDAEICGGSLVDSLHVVTAAHCVFGGKPADFRVLTGTQALNKGGTRRQIYSIKVHPKYNDKTTDYDIAVITLKTAATVAAYAKLMTSSQEATYAATGTDAIVTGWGSTIASGGGYPEELRQVTVPLVSHSNCNDANSYDGEITARMICAGFTLGGKDACDGDSGGPLVVKNAQGKWLLQAGIVSWGDGCARKNLYGVYSRVAVLSSWANGVIAADKPIKRALAAP